MVTGKAIIVNTTGIHARSASQFIAFISRFKCDISLIKDNKERNAKSILQLLMMGLNQGSEVTIKVEGDNEEYVLNEVINYISNMRD